MLMNAQTVKQLAPPWKFVLTQKAVIVVNAHQTGRSIVIEINVCQSGRRGSFHRDMVIYHVSIDFLENV